MHIRLHFTTETLKMLSQHWQTALKNGQSQLLKRITALQLLADQLAPERIAPRLGVAVSTIYGWLNNFIGQREKALIYGPKKGRKAKLDEGQLDQLKQKLLAGPLAAGFKSGLWNSAMVAQWIKSEFDQNFSVGYIPSLLKGLGFSYQKARFESDHLDPARRKEWLEEEWPKVVKQAREDKALLLFGDEASFAQWGSLSYTWAEKGHQPVVATSGVRKALKVFGMLDYFSGKLLYKAQTERFNAESYCQFLKEILEQTPLEQKVTIVQDGARYHTARMTKEFIEGHSQRLKVYQLPSYSPDYNPIEHLWRRVKRYASHNRYFESFEQLSQSVEAALAQLAAKSDEIKVLAGSPLDRWAV